MTPSAVRIFLSYGRPDIDDARRIADDLRTRGHEVWLDEDRLETGVDWERGIERGIAWCDTVVLLMTPASVRRRVDGDPESTDGYCLNEIAYAIHLRKPIIPVMLAPLDGGPPLSLSRLQWLDMTHCTPIAENTDAYAHCLERLITAIEEDDLEFEGGQARLMKLLEPLDFAADMAEHLGAFAGRRSLAAQIDRWLADDAGERVFLLTGRPGVGKTSIAVNLCHRRSDAFHMCVHGHEDKSDPRRAVLSIAYQLSTRLPAYRDRLRQIDPEACAKNADTVFDNLILTPLTTRAFPDPGRVVLVVIDALDEATRAGTNELADLIARRAKQLPSWVRLFITTRPDPEVIGRLQDLDPVVIEPDSEANLEDLREYVRLVLAELGHGGNDELVDLIADKSEGVFLYAVLVMGALRRGEIEIAGLPSLPRGMAAWYRQEFARRFPDAQAYEAGPGSLVDVVIAQNGPLPLDVLKSATGVTSRQLERATEALASFFPTRVDGKGNRTIAPVHKSLADWLVERDPTSGQLVAGPYAADPEEGARLLADHGWRLYTTDALPAGSYEMRYLPSQLLEIEDFARLRELLLDLRQLEAASEDQRLHEWMRFWRAIPDVDDPGPLYREVLDGYSDEPSVQAAHADRIGTLLREMGLLGSALEFIEQAIALRADLAEPVEHAASLRNLATLYRAQDWTGRARPIFEEALAIFEEAEGRASWNVAKTCHELAINYRDEQRYAEAMAYVQRALAIYDALDEPDAEGWGDCLNDMGVLLWEKGHVDASMVYFQRARSMFRETFGTNHPGLAGSLFNVANARRGLSDDLDLELMREALGILEAVYVAHNPEIRTCRAGFVMQLEWRPWFAESIPIRRQIVEMLELTNNLECAEEANDLERAIRRQAGIAEKLEPALATYAAACVAAPDAARRVQQPLERVTRGVMGSWSTPAVTAEPDAESAAGALMEALFQLGAYLHDFGYHPSAATILTATLALHDHAATEPSPRLPKLLERLASSRRRIGQVDLAIDPAERLCRLLDEVLIVPVDGHLPRLKDLADLYEAAGRYDDALETYAELHRRGAHPHHLSSVLNDAAVRLKNQLGEYEEAERHYRRALEYEPGSATILSNLALLLTSTQGRHDEAEALYRESVERCGPDAGSEYGNYAFFLHHVRHDEDGARAYYERTIEFPLAADRANYALLLIAAGDVDRAKTLVEEAWALQTRSGHDRISMRVLFVRAILETLAIRDPAFFLGQLRVLMESQPEHGPWAIQAFRDWLLDRLPDDDVAFFLALVEAISTKAGLETLRREARWRDVRLVPLDAPWPESDQDSSEPESR